MPSSNPLPPKENALFKRILKCYEQKQYKNGLKFSKQILSNPKFAEHGETMAMKGLTLNCLGRKEEAYDYVRRGLRNDVKSHVCWHVYGLLQRSDKKYEEAIKCYRNALKYLEGYKETRFQIFSIRPAQRSSWIGFAMSYHLLEDYDMALKILGEFRETYEKTTYDFEHSELLLYQNMVMNESGDVEGALNHLEKNKEAEEVYRSLIKRNPENHSHYDKLIDALEVRQDEDKQLEMYQSYTEKMPRAQAPRRLALVVAKGSNFKKLLDAYLKKSFKKGYKVKIIEETVTTYLENLLEYSSFEKKGIEEPVTAVLWVYYYLGQHYDFLGDHIKAVDAVDRAIEHTPTLIELLLLKGKINKHVGNIDEAVKYLNEAQSLDTADRYLNCKSAKYLLRANKVTEAEEMCQSVCGFKRSVLLAIGAADNFGDALKKCIEVDRHFTDMVEDQFDFHTYCMRKMTLRSYIELLRFEDQLRSHTFFEKAAHYVQAKKNLHNKAQKKNDDELDIPMKEELFPQKLERPQSPLNEAIKFLTPLQSLCSEKMETQLLAFEIYFRKEKPLLMLKCIKKAKKILVDTSLKALPPKVYIMFSKFHRYIESNMSKFHSPVKTVIEQETQDIFGKQTATQRNEEFIASNAKSFEHLAAGARIMVYLDHNRKDEALKIITQLHIDGTNIERCSDVLDDLINGVFGHSGKSFSEEYREKCSNLFPLTPKFKSKDSKQVDLQPVVSLNCEDS
ncbi:NAA15_16 [Lepeophtheirus salmonis]|uniref:NAA15_16 n=1 Tax=Lepeophtheirus salmonis TaxID=72036 RepID=A0A7R8D3D6_LEPSM|nr:NAA15_16 [Lepeophtheirus salmonis]CAF2983716.1 NAA15_16 [Lepeophtheirus salmonis]